MLDDCRDADDQQLVMDKSYKKTEVACDTLTFEEHLQILPMVGNFVPYAESFKTIFGKLLGSGQSKIGIMHVVRNNKIDYTAASGKAEFGIIFQGDPLDLLPPSVQILDVRPLIINRKTYYLLELVLYGNIAEVDLQRVMTDYLGCSDFVMADVINFANYVGYWSLNTIVSFSTRCGTYQASEPLLDIPELGTGYIYSSATPDHVILTNVTGTCGAGRHKVRAKCYTGVNLMYCNTTSGQDILYRPITPAPMTRRVHNQVFKLPDFTYFCTTEQCTGQHFYDQHGNIVCGSDCCLHSLDAGASIIKSTPGRVLRVKAARTTLTSFEEKARNIALRASGKKCNTDFAGIFDCWADTDPGSYTAFVVMGVFALIFIILLILARIFSGIVARWTHKNDSKPKLKQAYRKMTRRKVNME